MEKKNMNMWIWGGVLVLAILVYFFVFKTEKVISPTDIEEVDTEIVGDTNEGVETESVQDLDETVGAGAVSISYADALVKYKDRRIQLDSTCQARPNTVTYKDNTGVMFDNRSDQTRTIKVGTTYTIKPYGFKIVVLPDIYLQSKTILVDCDQSQNVATVLVQE